MLRLAASLAAGLLLLVAGCQAKGTCVVIEEGDDPAGADTCWVSYPRDECTAQGERAGQSVTFHVEAPSAGIDRCRRDGFVEDAAAAPADGAPISMTRPKTTPSAPAADG
jgi:hypothetical protein